MWAKNSSSQKHFLQHEGVELQNYSVNEHEVHYSDYSHLFVCTTYRESKGLLLETVQLLQVSELTHESEKLAYQAFSDSWSIQAWLQRLKSRDLHMLLFQTSLMPLAVNNSYCGQI